MRRQVGRVRGVVGDVRRIARVLLAPPERVVVGYTRPHTVYTDVFDVPSLEEFVMYRRTPRRCPRADFFTDRAVKRVLVWSRWAGGHYLAEAG